MDLPAPPSSRPAEHLLRAHLAHATHHELLDDEQRERLAAVVSSVETAPPAARTQTRKPRRKRST